MIQRGTGRSTLGGGRWEVVLVQYTVGLHIVFQDFGKGSFVLLLDTFRPPCHPWHTHQKKKQDDSSPHHQPVHTRFCHRTTTLTRVLLPRCFYCSPSLKRKGDPVCQCETPQPLVNISFIINSPSSRRHLPSNYCQSDTFHHRVTILEQQSIAHASAHC